MAGADSVNSLVARTPTPTAKSAKTATCRLAASIRNVSHSLNWVMVLPHLRLQGAHMGTRAIRPRWLLRMSRRAIHMVPVNARSEAPRAYRLNNFGTHPGPSSSRHLNIATVVSWGASWR